MPIYEYLCPHCRKITTKIHKPHRIPNHTLCDTPKCGRRAKRVIASSGAIRCDSINDVKWLPSALKTLPDSAAVRIQSRADHQRYLKENNLVAKG